MKYEILAFISLYQHYNYLQYLQIYANSEGVDETAFVIVFDENKISKNIGEGIFYCLMKYSNIKNAPQQIGHFSFIEQTYEREGFWIFGKNYNFDLFVGIEKKSNRIALIDAAALEYYYIADSEDAFLFYLMNSLIYENLSSDIIEESNWIRKFRSKIAEKAGGEKYQLYYEALFPTKEEANRIFELTMIPF